MKITDIFRKAQTDVGTKKSMPAMSGVCETNISLLQKIFFSFVLFTILLTTIVSSSYAGTYVVLGSQTITRSKGTPVDAVFNFDARDPSGSYELHITIGDIAVSSAELSINGTVVVGSKSFNANVTEIIQSVSLNTTNEFVVRLASKPDSSLTTKIIGYDNVAPEISATIAPPANAGNWNNTTVVVTFVCSDITSGIETCPTPVTVDLDGADQVVTGTAIDKAGNQASTSVTVNLDKTSATINSSIVPTPNAAGWNNTDLSINYLCEDVLSGVASCSPTVQVSTEGHLQSFTGTVIDFADNQANTIVKVSIDKISPNLTVTPNPIANSRKWNNSSVQLTYNCTDSLSGVATCAANNLIATEGEAQIITGTAIDVADNIGTLDTILNIDLTVPSITSSILPAANTEGWHKTNPTVSFTCSDALSGILTCPSSVVHSVEGGNQQVIATAVDNADNNNELSTAIKLDKTLPTISTSVSPTANTNDWHNTDATITYTCVDSISGVASCTSPVVVALEGASQVFNGTVVDYADNELSTSTIIKMDKTAPSISATVTPIANSEGWHNATVLVSFTCSDALSSIESCSAPITVNLESETNVVTGTAVDKAGNTTDTSVTIKFDLSAPLVSSNVVPIANANGWHNTDPTINFSCSDVLSGIATCQTPITVTTEGDNQSFIGTGIDNAGNQASTSVTVKLDKTPATIKSLIIPTPNSAGWNKTNLEINYLCDDALSGVASCSPTKQVTTEGALQTFTGNVVDIAGNQTSTIVTVKLDKTAPTLTASADPVANIRKWNNSSVNLTYSCLDPLSNIASCAAANLIETEGKDQGVIGSALDVAGNTGFVTTTLNIDLTVPNITSAILPAANTNGWHKTNPTVSFTCSDALSGILTCPSSVIHSVEGGNQQVIATAVDNADNNNELSTAIKLDKTLPTISTSVSPTANTNDWHNTDATITYTCVDSISGVASCTSPVVVALEGASQVFNGTVVDYADNELSTSTIIKMDKTAPSISATVTPVANSEGWHNATVLVSFACSDALSSIESCSAPITVNLESETNIVTGTAVDKAGNTTDTSVTIKIDLSAPVVSSNVVPIANANGWHNTDPTINFSCSDVLSGIATCQTPITVTTEADNQNFIGTGIDNAGNSATTTAIIKLDKTAPTITATITPLANAAGWHNGSSIVNFTCNDTLSGIDSCSPPVTVSLETGSNIVTGTAVDKAGNTTNTSVTLKLDLTAPIINTNVVPAANANGWHKTNPTVNFICSDVLSGIASCENPIVVSTETASQVVTGSAIDAADNSATTSTTIKLDKTAPTITTQLVPVANTSDWHNGDVVVNFICDDTLSGIETCPTPITVSIEGQGQVVTGTAIDKAGNTTETSVTLNIDLNIPNIDTTVSPTPNANGWNNTDATISYICTDILSGIQNCPLNKTVTTEGLAQLVSASATDKAGNTANTSNLLNIDKTVPTISSQVEPLANAAGWNNTTVVVSFTCADTLSGIETCPLPITVDIEVANKIITGTAIDKAGNTASTSVTLNIDKTAAVINGAITPLPNSAGWNNTDATVKFTCTDSLSSVANCSADQILTTEAENQIVTGTTTDLAGNTSSINITVNIDKTIPTITSTLTPTVNANGWFNTNPTITYTCADSLSSIATCSTAKTISLEASDQVVSASAVDKAGNSASVSDTINLDKTSPQITASIAPVANASGWNNSTVVVTFACDDSLSGIDSCSVPVTIDLDTASQIVSGTAIDKAGNSSETSVTVKLDKTAPVISIAPSVTTNAAGWFNADTTLTATCTDALSGIATCPAAQPINTEGAGQVVTMSATDIAGNTASSSLTLKIDKTAPSISSEALPLANSKGWNNSDVTITHACEDLLSGIATCTDTQTITAEGLNQAITSTAVDLAGNSTSQVTTLNIDKTAPTLNILAPLNGSVQTDNPPAITFTVNDNLTTDLSSIEIVVNGLLITAQCIAQTQQVECTLPTAINNPNAIISVQISDEAENSSTATTNIEFDSDADGTIDSLDVFPQDPTEWADLDGDGIGDNSDTDRDGDGFSNDHETLTGFDANDPASTPPDLDGDFIPDSLDTDRDGDGVANDVDAFPDNATESSDLDGDGVGDNTDLDRDGDGFSNLDELAAGSNPDDATDFPDTTAPVITLNGTTSRNTELDLIVLTGTVSDSSSGVATVVISSDRYTGLSFDAVITANQWAASVPVEIGTNQLNIVATDNSNNSDNILLSVDRTVANLDVSLTIDYPTPNLTVTAPDIVIRGQLQSNKPALQKSVTVNGLTATLTATSQVTIFNFESQTVTLSEGVNSITVQANVDDQSLQKSVLVTYQKEQTQTAAPVIAALLPTAGSYQTSTSFTLVGRVTTTAGLKTLNINNQAVAFSSTSAPDYNFQEILNFPSGSSQLDVVIVATDNLDQVTQQTVSYYQDQTAPVIQLQQSLLAPSEVNVIREQPYTLSGTITDANLASFFINNAEVGLTPVGNGVYSFNMPITLGQLIPLDLVLTASDQAGNQTTQTYILQLDGSVSVSILQPENNAELLSTGVESTLSVTARIEGNAIPQGITSTATLLNETGVVQSSTNLVISSGLATGEITIPATAGSYNLDVEVVDVNGAFLSKTSHQLSVIDSSTIAVEIARVQPKDSETGIEPNESISLFFNKPIDTTKLVIYVHETAHGNTYIDMDELGTDGINAKGYQLQEVNRDYQLVKGALSVLPNNQVVAFYPEVEFAYDSTVFVDVLYDGQELLRSQFKTRSLPTFVTGFVVDQLNQPIPGIEVKIPELSRTTKTNSEGAYAFGYGDSDKNILPGGSYTVQYNSGLKNPLFGNHTKEINIQKHHRNTVSSISLPVLNQSVPFVPAAGRKTLNLLQGSLKLDLTQADLQFPDGRRNGDIHTQVLSFSQIPYQSDDIAVPLFAYSVQPSGVKVEGDIAIDMLIPKLNNSYAHVPDDGIYVLLVGLSREHGRLVPVGVAEIQNKRLLSRGKVNLHNLDYIGYGLAQIKSQDVIKQYVNGETSFVELIIQIRQLQAQ